MSLGNCSLSRSMRSRTSEVACVMSVSQLKSMRTNEPLVPSYSSTSLVSLVTKRFPLGPNVSPNGRNSPPDPEETKAPNEEPSMPLNDSTLSVKRLATRSVPPGFIVRPVG